MQEKGAVTAEDFRAAIKAYDKEIIKLHSSLTNPSFLKVIHSGVDSVARLKYLGLYNLLPETLIKEILERIKLLK